MFHWPCTRRSWNRECMCNKLWWPAITRNWHASMTFTQGCRPRIELRGGSPVACVSRLRVCGDRDPQAFIASRPIRRPKVSEGVTPVPPTMTLPAMVDRPITSPAA